MARPNQRAIEKFKSITGVTEAIAVQKLEKCGDVIDALIEHFNEGDRNVAGEVRETPIDVTDGNQYTPQDEQTNKILSDTSLCGSARDEQMTPFRTLNEFPGVLSQENLDLDLAILLSIETAEQEGAQRLQGDVSAPIVGPPESSGMELGKIAASNGRLELLDVERSFFQDLAKHADFFETGTMSSSGNWDSKNNPRHNRNAILGEELGGISSVERDDAIMLEAIMLGGIPEGNGYSLPDDVMQNRACYPQPAPRPPSPSLSAQRLIREQQDDECLESLQADREKELRAVEEAKAAREEESQKKLQEKEHGGDVIDTLNEYMNEGDRNMAGEVGETPIDVMDWDQYTPQAGHAHYSHQDEQTNKILSDTSLGGSAKDEKLTSFSVLIECARQMCQEKRDIETPEQEAAQRLKGDVSSPIVGPPESSGVELGKITASNGRLQAGLSFFQDEAEDAGEQPLTRKRSKPTPLGSTDLAKKADFFEASLMSSSGSPESINNSQHNRNAFLGEELGGISSVERDDALMLEAIMLGGIPEGNGYSLPDDVMQNRACYPQPAPRPPSPSLSAQRLIREQQDDECLESLQADREKELRAVEEAKAAREEESQKKLQEEKCLELERRLAAKEAALPPEPSSEDENAVTLLVKMPDGRCRGRRFLRSDNLQYLFDFIDISWVVKPGTYRLVRPYPRRVFSDGEGALTLNEVGVTNKKEVLYLELI